MRGVGGDNWATEVADELEHIQVGGHSKQLDTPPAPDVFPVTLTLPMGNTFLWWYLQPEQAGFR